jgi:hypothetical protein
LKAECNEILDSFRKGPAASVGTSSASVSTSTSTASHKASKQRKDYLQFLYDLWDCLPHQMVRKDPYRSSWPRINGNDVCAQFVAECTHLFACAFNFTPTTQANPEETEEDPALENIALFTGEGQSSHKLLLRCGSYTVTSTIYSNVTCIVTSRCYPVCDVTSPTLLLVPLQVFSKT